MRSYSVTWYHQVPRHVKEILGKLSQNGHKALIVGGAVRDMALGITPKDFDLVSSASTETIANLFPKTLDIGKKFGIMVVVTDEGPVEIARFRSDGAYSDFRHPDSISFEEDPLKDAQRRDFTINALFYDGEQEAILDYIGGMEDLQSRILKTVGDPSERFEEDALRMLRAVRFIAQLTRFSFIPDPSIFAAIKNSASLLAKISKERITKEFGLILESPSPSKGLIALKESALWEFVLGIDPFSPTQIESFDQAKAIYDKQFSITTSTNLLFALFAQINIQFLDKNHLILPQLTHMNCWQIMENSKKLENWQNLELAQQKILSHDSKFPEAWSIGKALHQIDAEQIIEQRLKWSQEGKLNPPPILSGLDLKDLGWKAGPKMGEALKLVREAQLNEEISTRDQALALIETIFGKSSTS